MSAFVVNKSHIDAMLRAGLANRYCGLLTWYIREEPKYHELNHDNANAVGQMLVDECVKSVSFRYEDDTLTNLPGPLNTYWIIPYQFNAIGKVPTPIETIKLINCYMYQSCEHPEWEDSEARVFCKALKETMINLLSGYDQAPWEWEEEALLVSLQE